MSFSVEFFAKFMLYWQREETEFCGVKVKLSGVFQMQVKWIPDAKMVMITGQES
ncbi:MAG: hypothetical protein ACOX1Y_03075 [Zhaonellaceae bacterium]|jgi:hypothetical protein